MNYWLLWTWWTHSIYLLCSVWWLWFERSEATSNQVHVCWQIFVKALGDVVSRKHWALLPWKEEPANNKGKRGSRTYLIFLYIACLVVCSSIYILRDLTHIMLYSQLSQHRYRWWPGCYFATRAPLQYPIRRLIVRSREVLKPRYW